MKTIVTNKLHITDQFLASILLNIPENVMEFWNIELNTKGIVRYDHDKLDAIYIDARSKFISNNSVKFNFINGSFIFDSIYSQYDPIKNVKIHPYDHRYDKGLNILAVYKFNDSVGSITNTENPTLVEEAFCVQYKNDLKVKEYVFTEEIVSLEILNDLKTHGIISGEFMSAMNMNCLNVKGYKSLKHFFIR